MFKKVQINGQENLVEVTHKVCGRNGRVDYVQAFESPDNRSVAIPARQEIVIDMNEVARLQEWRKELMSRFGH